MLVVSASGSGRAGSMCVPAYHACACPPSAVPSWLVCSQTSPASTSRELFRATWLTVMLPCPQVAGHQGTGHLTCHLCIRWRLTGARPAARGLPSHQTEALVPHG